MKCAGYIRCSTGKQDLESQRFVLNEWAKKNSHDLTLFEDFAISGKKESRVGLNELMRRCKAGEFEGVAVVEISRFGRSIKIIYGVVEELTTLKIKIILAGSGSLLDYNSLEGRALIGGLALAADIEWMLISERNKRGREKIKRDGIKVGRKRAEEGAVSLDAVLSLQEKGYGFRKIAKELNTSISTISRMLKRCRSGQKGNVSFSNCEPHETGQN